MDGPSIIGLSGQVALQRQLDAVANNIANASTAGYRGDRTLFQSHVQRLAVPGGQVSFVEDRATYIDPSQGRLTTTGNPLDVAIDGEGFLAVERRNGPPGYTRDGRLRVAPDRTLVDGAGRPVLDDGNGRILMPDRASKIEVREDGTMIATVDGRPELVARLGLFNAADLRAVRKGGDGLLDIPQAQLRPVDPATRAARFAQGTLEDSTVQPVAELASLSDIQRSYERMQRIVSDDQDRLRRMIEAFSRTF
ncbi:flagellar hook basal-body protein [Paracraurococcus ruber]|uniref:Flagellar biosynthesis protein FlgF n=1 Tax=Paracraurococcus ruber TaxID=77675 RepID=A0ABS1CZH8_9PROT|nr:flagellar hook basal-body protein [Paracraurococcus ruber]MBK1659940.1 flagellar biosynthesis protein FlgF [Paracraurococcus ruber]TDG28836.1 flagellar hook basal-body protein [Paracraurococcus ruber]